MVCVTLFLERGYEVAHKLTLIAILAKDYIEWVDYTLPYFISQLFMVIYFISILLRILMFDLKNNY